jgi:hypothetical protein
VRFGLRRIIVFDAFFHTLDRPHRALGPDARELQTRVILEGPEELVRR